MPPVVAALALLLGGGFAARSIVGTFAPEAGGEVVQHDEADGDPAAEGAHPGDAPAWTDLLAVHGSFDAEASVRLAFFALREATVPAAPSGETVGSLAANDAWLGEAPPSLRVGVVMISSHARRAVLAGRVVGIGDQVGEVRITRIDPGLVGGHWRDRTLTWDLTGEVPREFRAEHARRNAKAEAAVGAPAIAAPAMPGTPPTAPAPAKGRQEQDR